jgi:spore germination cell wall hydrolase CwlJ-like protein
VASDLSPRDRDLMIRTVLGEAADQGPRGQAAVASVILNRVAAGKYGKSPADVVLAPNQFEPWSTRSKELMGYKPESADYRNVGDIVDMVASGDVPDPTSGSTHFLQKETVLQRRGSLPSWARDPVTQIGAHTFYAPEGRVVGMSSGVDPMDAINRALSGEE